MRERGQKIEDSRGRMSWRERERERDKDCRGDRKRKLVRNLEEERSLERRRETE